MVKDKGGIQVPLHNNACGRLAAVLRSIPKDTPVRKAIFQLFNYKANSVKQQKRLAVLGLAKLTQFYDDFLEDLENYFDETQRQNFMRTLVVTSETFYPASFEVSFTLPPDSELASLDLYASFLPQDGEVSEDEIGQIKLAIAELQNLVAASDISPTLRKSLLAIIGRAENAINEFRIRGAKGFRQELKLILGEAGELTMTEDKKPPAEHEARWPEAKSTIEWLLDCAYKVAKTAEKLRPVIAWGLALARLPDKSNDVPLLGPPQE